jgi:ABC-type multidrug transport system ATPase subunit
MQELRTFTRVSGYVEQFDIHSPQATILEALWFSARLRQPNDISNRNLDLFIRQVLHPRHLVCCSDGSPKPHQWMNE